MFIAALHTTAKIGKQPQFPLMNKWIKKLWCVCVFAYICIHIYAHTHRDVEYYSAIKNEEILPFATTWMDLEGIMKYTHTHTLFTLIHICIHWKRP